MPKVVFEVPETEESISRPIASAISKQVINRIGLDKSVRIMMPFEDLGVANQNTTMDEGINDPNRLNTIDQMEVIYEEDYNETNQFTRAYAGHEENKSIFTDDQLKIYMFTNYQQIKGTLRCVLRSTDQAKMARWIKAIKSRVEQEYMDGVHMVSYHIPIPVECMYMICEMYNMRERNVGLGETLGAYFSRSFVKNFTTLVNPAGNNTTYVLAENQIKITGYYDFGNMPPKPTKLDGAGAYTLEFTYNYIYDRCDDIVMDYPLMVHNQHIPDWMYDKKIPYEVDNYLTRSNFSTNNMNEVYGYNVSVPKPDDIRPGLPIPFYDTWYTPKNNLKYFDIVRVLLAVKSNNANYVGMVGEIGDWYFKKNTLKYMKDQYESMLIPNHSVLLIRLFAFNDLLNYRELTIDKDLHVLYTPGMDIRKMYHVSISLLSDPTRLTPEGLEALSRNGCFAYEYLLKLYPEYEDSIPLPDANCYMNLKELTEFLDTIRDKEQNDRTYSFAPFMTVNRGTINGKHERLE